MTIKILLIILILNSLLYSSEKITIQELIALSSQTSSKPIVLDQNIDKTTYIYSSKQITPSNINLILRTLLDKNDFILEDKHSFYFIRQKEPIPIPEPEKVIERVIYIRYLKDNDIKKILSKYDYKYFYINNYLYIYSKLDDFKAIKKLILSIDRPTLQKQVKIIIAETDLNKLKELGVNYSYNDQTERHTYNLDLGNFVSFNTPSEITRFKLDLKFLVENGITNIITSPVLTLRDLKTTKFDITKTIPVKKSTQIINDANINTTESISYESYGIKLELFSRLIQDKTDLDFNLVLQDILSTSDNMPVTSDKKLTQSILLNDGQIFMLSGFKKQVKQNNKIGIPILKDIPYLGPIFSWDSDNYSDIALYIMIQIINSNSIKNDDEFETLWN